jgi:hypothetical protein
MNQIIGEIFKRKFNKGQTYMVESIFLMMNADGFLKTRYKRIQN